MTEQRYDNRAKKRKIWEISENRRPLADRNCRLRLPGGISRILGQMGRVVGRGDGQAVAAVVLDGLGVALDPDEADPVAAVDL